MFGGELFLRKSVSAGLTFAEVEGIPGTPDADCIPGTPGNENNSLADGRVEARPG
jgi:hypothetical protein